jgi:hypothetical protein
MTIDDRAQRAREVPPCVRPRPRGGSGAVIAIVDPPRKHLVSCYNGRVTMTRPTEDRAQRAREVDDVVMRRTAPPTATREGMVDWSRTAPHRPAPPRTGR